MGFWFLYYLSIMKHSDVTGIFNKIDVFLSVDITDIRRRTVMIIQTKCMRLHNPNQKFLLG